MLQYIQIRDVKMFIIIIIYSEPLPVPRILEWIGRIHCGLKSLLCSLIALIPLKVLYCPGCPKVLWSRASVLFCPIAVLAEASYQFYGLCSPKSLWSWFLLTDPNFQLARRYRGSYFIPPIAPLLSAVRVVDMAPVKHKQVSLCSLVSINLVPALVGLCHSVV